MASNKLRCKRKRGMTKLQKIIGGTLVSLSVGAIAIQFAFSTDILKTKANEVAYLDANNSPELTNGEGTMEDSKGVTWEYHNAEDYASGHVSIGHEGYFGISSNSAWGLSGIQSLRVDYTADAQSELWLLTSLDGAEWGEQLILEDDISTTLAKNWRYIRFYNYSSSDSPIDITCVYIHAECVRVEDPEELDSAHIGNVGEHTDTMTAYQETTDVSPLGNSTEAVRFEKTGTKSTTVVISLWRSYTVGEIINQKIEYDLKVTTNYGKTVELMSGNNTVGTGVNSNDVTSFEITDLGNNWYHIELPVNAIVSLISGYGKDNIPPTGLENKAVDGIRFNVGNATIDNLRITGTQCDLGFFNSPRYTPKVGTALWVKVSWVGRLESCTLTTDDNTIARPLPTTDPNLKHASPFYVECVGAGAVTVTVKLVVGYNRQQLPSITKTFTIS